MRTASLWMRGGLLSALLAILASACGGGSAVLGPEDPPLGVIVACDGTPVTGFPWRQSTGPEAALVRIAEQVPGFGGLFRDGEAVGVWLMDLSLKDQAEPHIRHHIRFRWNDSSDRAIDWRQGRYDWRQLVVWRNCLRAPMHTVGGVLTERLDAGRNRIVFRVRSEAARSAAESVLAGTRVPRQAVVFDVLGGSEPLAPDLPSTAEAHGLTIRAGTSLVDRAPDLLRVHVRVANTSDQPIPVHYGHCAVRVALYREGSPESPAWSQTGACLLYLVEEVLAPGDTIPQAPRRTVPHQRLEFAPRILVHRILSEPLPEGRYEAVARVRFGIGPSDTENEVDLTLSAGTVELTHDQPPLPSTRTLDEIRWTAASERIDDRRFRVVLGVENLGEEEVGVRWRTRGCPLEIGMYREASERDAAWRRSPDASWPPSPCRPAQLILRAGQFRSFADTVDADRVEDPGPLEGGTWHLAIRAPVFLAAGEVAVAASTTNATGPR